MKTGSLVENDQSYSLIPHVKYPPCLLPHISGLFERMICRLCDGLEVGDDKVVTELRSELWEKERKLTDVRLEALSSAHQLEQLQDAMTNMQVRVICFL